MKRRKIGPPPPPKAVRRAEWRARFGRLLGLGFCTAGFAAIALGWAGAARRTCVDCQIPYLISGGAAGLALVVFGAGLLVMAQMRTEARRLSARIEHMTWTLAERFMGAATIAANGDPVHQGSDHPTTDLPPRKRSAVVRAEGGSVPVDVVSDEPSSEPNPWWERSRPG